MDTDPATISTSEATYGSERDGEERAVNRRDRRPRRRADPRTPHYAGPAQQQLAEMIGVTYQQAHKYERGINRVSAGRLFEIARALSAPISYFYGGIGEEGPRQIMPHQRMLLEIARNLAEIRNEKHQEAVSQLARALASG
jgi:transcriptional regulator with XRE-family HTH domain